MLVPLRPLKGPCLSAATELETLTRFTYTWYGKRCSSLPEDWSSQFAKNGDIVVAEVDGAWTLKYFRTDGKKTWLQPANKNYKPICVD